LTANSGLGALEVRRLGRTAYADAHALQEGLLAQRVEGAVGDVLLLTEHEPVITVGRGTPQADQSLLAATGIPVIEVERGGEATYHGPGQLVAYPILLLPEGRRDLHHYLRDLEAVVIGLLSELGIEGTRRPGLTGVWIGERKVCSIGVAVRRWVTWHGLALNLHTDLAPFRRFRPCGLSPDVMTRVADHAELPPTNLLGEVLLVKHFCRVFGHELPPMPPSGEPAGPGFRPLPVL
jgi:lipoyl(octanoyl) transferase